MERLTRKVDGKIVFPSELVGVTLTPDNVVLHELICRLAAYEDTGLTPAEVNSMSSEWCAMMSVWNSMGNYNRLHELAEADNDGRLVILPCKVGDTVYFKTYDYNGTKDIGIQAHKVTAIVGNTIVRGKYIDIALLLDQYGVSWFLAREEAEKALEAMKDG